MENHAHKMSVNIYFRDFLPFQFTAADSNFPNWNISVRFWQSITMTRVYGFLSGFSKLVRTTPISALLYPHSFSFILVMNVTELGSFNSSYIQSHKNFNMLFFFLIESIVREGN